MPRSQVPLPSLGWGVEPGNKLGGGAWERAGGWSQGTGWGVEPGNRLGGGAREQAGGWSPGTSWGVDPGNEATSMHRDPLFTDCMHY